LSLGRYRNGYRHTGPGGVGVGIIQRARWSSVGSTPWHPRHPATHDPFGNGLGYNCIQQRQFLGATCAIARSLRFKPGTWFLLIYLWTPCFVRKSSGRIVIVIMTVALPRYFTTLDDSIILAPDQVSDCFRTNGSTQWSVQNYSLVLIDIDEGLAVFKKPLALFSKSPMTVSGTPSIC
jgi:hypothetical protein